MISSIESKLIGNSFTEFVAIPQVSSEIHVDTLAEGDVFLVGPLTVSPLQQVQRATQQNTSISILVLVFQEQYSKIKQSIQFGQSVGKNVSIISYQFGKDISGVLESAVMRTRQRKSFKKIQEQTFPQVTRREVTFNNLGIFLENAPIGAIVFDKERKVISANGKAKRFFGKKLDLRYRVTWADLFPGEDYSMLLNPGLESVHEVIKVNNLFLEVNISPYMVDSDMPQYLLLVNDVTRAIDVENQLKGKIEELEFLNRELDEFVNVVSHDFKTPLTSISLLTDLALRESSGERIEHFLLQIKRNGNKLKEQLEGLNKLVDLKKGRSEKVENVNFQQTFDMILKEYQESLSEIDGKLVADFSQAPGMPYFSAHIDSLFSNLITNAIKYRRAGTPLLVEIFSKREQDYTVLTVRDNGIGIDLEKNLNLLFQPFKRLTDQGTGSGLGLSIVKRMIEHNHGYLEVFSEVKKGTEFKAYLKNIVS